MDSLVARYERAVEDLIQRDHKISRLTDDLVQHGRDNERLHQQNIELKTQIDNQRDTLNKKVERTETELKEQIKKQADELFDVYSSLRRKEEVLRGMEERLNRKLNDKEEQCMQLQTKVSNLEQTFSKETLHVENLRRLYEERNEAGMSLENTLRQKETMIKEMQDEQAATRMANERAFREREEELLIQLQNKNASEFNLTQEIQQLQRHLKENDEQAQGAQRVTNELKDQILDLERELDKKEQQRQRWEDEVKRLESAQNYQKNQ